MWGKASKFDIVYRKLLLTKFFTKGWGSPDTIKRIFELGKILSDRSTCQELVDENYPIIIDKDEEHRGCRIVAGHFHSPFADFLPDVMPQEVQTARFQMVLPLVWPRRGKPVCIHLAGTGDHNFWRRRILMARPLVKEYGIGSLLLENPYYGHRKPKDQLRSSLNNVSDLFVMGGALILESLTLLHWCEKNGYGPLGLTGISMGGHMATLAATNWHKPIPLIPCLSWSSATPVFTDGVMSGSIPWKLLATQYVCHAEYEGEIMKNMLKCPQTDAFRLGQEFATNFPDSYENLRNVRFRKGLEKLSRLKNTRKNTPIGEDNKTEQCSEKLVTKSADNPDQSNLCNDKSKTTSTNYVLTNKQVLYSNQVLSNISPAIEEVDGIQEVSSPFATNQHHHLQSTDVGILQQTPSHMLKANDDIADKVLFDNKDDDLISNCRVKITKEQCHLHQDFVKYGSDLDGEFIKETSNIPVIDSLSNQSKDANNEKDKLTKDVMSTHAHDQVIQITQNKGQERSQQVHRSNDIKDQQKSQHVRRINIVKSSEFINLKEEAMEFMHGVMDAATFVGNFSTPVDRSLIIVLTATQDGYIPRDNVPSLQELWPGIEVRYLNSGHVQAILFMQHQFRRAINDAFNKYMNKYPDAY